MGIETRVESSGGMQTGGGVQASLGGRYAIALFGLARDGKAIDAVAESLAALKRALAESDDLRALVESPLLGRAAAGKAIGAAASEMGLDPLTAKFLGVLAANRRLRELPAIIRAFSRLAASHRGETSAEVVSAHPLSDDQVRALKDRLRQQTGKDVAVDLAVDPAILGGLVVKLGSRQIDGSIRTKLNMLAHAMKG